MNASPATRNLTIHQHTDWTESFDILVDDVPVALAGYSIVGKCRKGEDVSSPLVFTFTFALSGTLATVSVPAATTAAIDLSTEPDQPQYFYDYVLSAPSGTRTKIQAGRLTIERTVT